ncbi:hypothetical protein BMW24_004460 [Mycobacterium heckeshornense]|uniref:Uncharacterized protein n=1 Tax=Mycobacterium heckeshornense TaxID=110505 RepID=A0A2G8BGM4_9MYCO|nr:hypothetical protein [Mycobacterium heckeshornense]KMV14245.1 hypothetical protein ACT16_23540 [Mycobacterium heckeshornense]MCV7034487.1 hypothetical protein [Mycobacterium heckeshornense]PIJ36951.1 hypothetical protein BMW24_004460 [Mycobacterium heckeshornense]BCO35270.1 hypothetical protein MHEC_17030 [Mycobacterium heckeshornense]BCO36717.1 hypothetical protein MHEC_31500 [Mycobacterium heckeshornense]
MRATVTRKDLIRYVLVTLPWDGRDTWNVGRIIDDLLAEYPGLLGEHDLSGYPGPDRVIQYLDDHIDHDTYRRIVERWDSAP